MKRVYIYDTICVYPQRTFWISIQCWYVLTVMFVFMFLNISLAIYPFKDDKFQYLQRNNMNQRFFPQRLWSPERKILLPVWNILLPRCSPGSAGKTRWSQWCVCTWEWYFLAISEFCCWGSCPCTESFPYCNPTAGVCYASSDMDGKFSSPYLDASDPCNNSGCQSDYTPNIIASIHSRQKHQNKLSRLGISK